MVSHTGTAAACCRWFGGRVWCLQMERKTTQGVSPEVAQPNSGLSDASWGRESPAQGRPGRHSDVNCWDFWLFRKTDAYPFRLLVPQLQDEKGVPISSQYEMPCFTADPRPPHYLDSSAILPYFRAIQPILNNQTLDVVIEHLDKLEFQRAPKTNISVPTDQFEKKRFILTILNQFSNCLNSDLQMELDSRPLDSGLDGDLPLKHRVGGRDSNSVEEKHG
nr:interleukin-31 [Camelus bactrianus]